MALSISPSSLAGKWRGLPAIPNRTKTVFTLERPPRNPQRFWVEVGRLEFWLRRRLNRSANTCLALSPVALLGGILLLFLTFWFSYAVITLVFSVVEAIPQLVSGTRWKVGHVARLVVTGVFLALLFYSYLRSNRWQRWDIGSLEEPPSALGQTLWRIGGASRAGLLLMNPELSARLIAELLYIGPQVLVAGWNLLRESGETRRADAAAGARVLWTLLTQPRRVGYEELESLYTAGELNRAFLALRLVPEVVFLELGVTVSGELRQELANAAALDS
ncbi:MAG: hypothetical protein RIS76_2643 [Verrucomicrobiota bacterium]